MHSDVRGIRRSYVILLAAGLSVIWLLLHLAPDSGIAPLRAAASRSLLTEIVERLREPFVLLMLQIISIVTLAKIAGRISVKLGQPAVFGEILAGILLGPSLLGLLAPAAQAWLFPVEAMRGLDLISQLGVVIFLFGIGAELDVALLRRRSMQILLVSHASIIVPFALGIVLAYWLYARYAPPTASFTNFALFMGIAMSITAFPVLVRILRERGMTGTQLGDMATACAAIGDVTAWCLLAGVVSIVQSADATTTFTSMGMTLAWSWLLLRVLRPALKDLVVDPHRTGSLIGLLLLFALFSATVTALIGIHALFGAFIAGAAVASNSSLREIVLVRIEPMASALLLPLFFAYTGLRTQIGLLDGYDWAVCAVIIAVATLGKLGGAGLAARLTGSSWRDASVLGLLMNTRGLMELVVLNVGYELGFLSDRVFAMMVLMAIITTFATGPLVARLQKHPERAHV